MPKPKSIDTTLLILILILMFGGFLVFSSASLGLMARNGASFASVAVSQLVFGIFGGSIALLLTSNIYYRNWRKYAFYFFLTSLLLTAAVFIPKLGMSHGGATRWLNLGFTTIQPSEFLKLGFVIYMATWLSGIQTKITEFRYGLLPFLIIVGITGFIMLLQPDTDTFVIMSSAGIAMYITAGARWRDVAIMILIGIILIAIIAFSRPYVMSRITTFLNPMDDPQGNGWQVQQSLIAIGTGGLTGRGFGQSIQKFEYLPEPIGDSIFSVFAEEFGFIGGVILISSIVFLSLRGYKIAAESRDVFGTLITVGIITLIIGQTFLNIGAMMGVAPLSGLPLPFVSHGGTALMATLASLGIVINVSKYRTFKKSS